ncbi:MAG: hemerythrin family protein [Gammaproteobacteria bacterium]|nr:hemerythrin family protein [Gammaproteobacteria bacterium]
MSNFQWNEKLSVGNAEIDADHKGLFELIAELENSAVTRGFLSYILGRLEGYAAEHFAREEQLMRRVGYPGFDAHIREHKAFVEWLETVKSTYTRAAESPYLIGDLVNDFLRGWLTRHIMEEDMKYRDFISERKRASN